MATRLVQQVPGVHALNNELVVESAPEPRAKAVNPRQPVEKLFLA